METYEYTVQLRQNKARNQKEVQALQRALDATGTQARSLMISVDSLNDLPLQQKLFELPCLSCLESLGLDLNFSLGATSLGILAKVIQAGQLRWLHHLSISYRGDEKQRQHPRSSCSPQSRNLSSSSHSLLSSSSSEGRLGSQSSSSTSRSHTSTFQDGNSRIEAPVSWEGFALLAGVLRENLLPRLERGVFLSTDWGSRNLGDVGVGHFADLLGTGYFPGLKELNLEDNLIGSDGMMALAVAFEGGANMTALEVLNLNKNLFHASVAGGMDIVRIMAAGCLPSLKWIGLSGAGHQAIPTGGSIADQIVTVFIKNTSLITDVQIDWPDKILQKRWKAVWDRNLKLSRNYEEIPAAEGKTSLCGIPTSSKPTLVCSRFRTFIRKERKLRHPTTVVTSGTGDIQELTY